MKRQRPPRKPRQGFSMVVFLVGLLYAAWERHLLWRHFVAAVRRPR